MAISIQADPTLPQGYIKVNGTTAATFDATGFVTGGVPAGAVMSFAMNTAPAGWLAADGSIVSRTTYATLFTAIGTIYGAGDGSTTFTLPDLRGYFVRGAGTNSDGTASGAFGAKQADAFQDHTHRANAGTGGAGAPTNGAYGKAIDSGDPFSSHIRLASEGSIAGQRTAAETRPRNIAMLYCLKA